MTSDVIVGLPSSIPPSSSLLGSNNSLNHSTSCFRGGCFSITVRKDNDGKEKAGIKFRQNSKGQIVVKNVAKNGLFGDTELNVGDIILSVNGRKFNDKNTFSGTSPDELITECVHSSSPSITVSFRKPSSSSSLISSHHNRWPLYEASQLLRGKKSSKKESKQPKVKSKVQTVSGGKNGNTSNNNSVVVTFSVEKLLESNTDDSDLGLVLEIRNKDQLFVKNIRKSSAFSNATSSMVDDGCSSSSSKKSKNNKQYKLNAGDRILSINDMNFRCHADVEYAYRVLRKAQIMITLVVKKNQRNDNGRYDAIIDEDNNDDFCTHGAKMARFKKGTAVTNSSVYEHEIKTDFKIEKYRPETITVIKPRKWTCSIDSIGLEFRLSTSMKGRKPSHSTRWIQVKKIDRDSFFANTNLQVGDNIISINDVNFRDRPDGSKVEDIGRAYDTCLKSRERITIVVLKRIDTFLEKSSNFKDSTTNLEWKF